MTKFYLSIILIAFPFFFSDAQTTEEKAKVLFFEAERYHQINKYEESNLKLKEAQSLLGNNNVRIQHLRVKNFYAIKNYQQTKQEISIYFKLNPVNNEDISEIINIKSAIEEKEKLEKIEIEKENLAWNNISTSTKPADYNNYIQAYPKGKYVETARERMDYYEFFENSITTAKLETKMYSTTYKSLSQKQKYDILLNFAKLDMSDHFFALIKNDNQLFSLSLKEQANEILKSCMSNYSISVLELVLHNKYHQRASKETAEKVDDFYFRYASNNKVKLQKYMAYFPTGKYGIEANNQIQTINENESKKNKEKYSSLMAEANRYVERGNKDLYKPYWYSLAVAGFAGLGYLGAENDLAAIQYIGIGGVVFFGISAMVAFSTDRSDYYFRKAKEKREEAQKYVIIAPIVLPYHYNEHQSDFTVGLALHINF